MKQRRRSPRRRWLRLLLAGLLLVVLLQTGALLERYSAAPAAADDCTVQVSPAPASLAPGVLDGYPRWLTQERGTVSDASCLTRTPVYGVARPRSTDELRRALSFARSHGLSVSVSGTRHSMGGQASYPQALVLDMRDLDRVVVDEAAGTVRVGGGATWRKVLEASHARGLSVAAMPSIDVLSVGGTLSANAHGADFRVGSLASTVRSLRVMTADGTVRTVDRATDPELFGAVIGGYGLFGVIVEAELDLVPAEMYRLRQRTVPTADFPALFQDSIAADENTRLMYAHLSTSPSSFLQEAIVYTYERIEGYDEPMPPLREEQDSRVARLVLNVARHGGVGQRLKWSAQRHVLPRVRACHQPRSEALRAAEACLVSRNQAMYNGLGLLRNRLTRYTDVLQEYFLAPEQLVPFLREARGVLNAHDAQLLSASVRAVHDEEVLLDYARGDRLSVVLYLSQEVSVAGNRDMARLNQELIAIALRHGGTFYLPYQQHYTGAQLRQAYPMVDDFFALKRQVDPELLFMNGFYSRYADAGSAVTASGSAAG
ncbi:FAD-binding oxidoreductase [Nocardioides mesophilus]|uniref:FAD-binding oxidoreductase n=1 Tax=Nocardioides mesophilus TaxID=433659 RepID=A0A7G9R9S7_9ACTN|nr:FAD-binding oxidoreductase [Nocardioides mesophilus]QNN52352.1 FAD-binding oxidoreductase [Nocardioides mesophilus]